MNTVSPVPACPRCGHPIPPGAPQGLCPRCVLLGAATSTDSGGSALRREAPDLESVRAAFPQLELRELIGQGGMGFVYTARQPHLDRVVALKLLPITAGSDPAFAERFSREGRLLARLNHPNIVAVYDFGETQGFCYLILEYVDGVNLRQAMQSGRFSPAEALTIVPRICEALQYAHDQGVLHRDIKPENILLDARGRVKIADFGIAKLIGDRTNDITLTASGARLGTPHYMAPEQVESPSAVDHRADIYSLGVVFYELLTGELPLGRFAPPSSKAVLDARIDEIVLRALAKERELRQQSAGEVQTQVEGLATGAGPAGSSRSNPRGAFHPWAGPRDLEYKSSHTLAGLPLVHVVSGIDPNTGRPREARGILAIGPRAVGGVAIGGTARGIVAIGGMAMGGVAFGGVAVGLLALGGFAAGVFSVGGFALALLLAAGGFAVGLEAFGGVAAGHRALGGVSYSQVQGLATLGWEPTVLKLLPWLWLPSLVPILVAVGLGTWAARRQGRPPAPDPTRDVRPNPWPHRLFWLIAGPLSLLAAAILAGILAPVWMSHSHGPRGGVFRMLTFLTSLFPAIVAAGAVFQYRRTRPGRARAIPVAEWSPWPKRIFVWIVALVLVPALLVMAGVLATWFLSRTQPPLPPLPAETTAPRSAETTPPQGAPELTTYFGSLSLEIPVDQTVLVTARHWSNGIPNALPVTNGVWTWGREPLPSAPYFPGGRPSHLLGQPGSADWNLWLFCEGELIPVGFPDGFMPQHSQLQIQLQPNAVTNAWVFADARPVPEESNRLRSGIQVTLTTRAAIPEDAQYQEAARTLLTLHSRRRSAPEMLEMLGRQQSWDKRVTPDQIEQKAAEIRALDVQIRETTERVRSLAAKVGLDSGSLGNP